VSSYRADIEIGVRGARNLEQLRSSINQTARAVDSLNDVVSARGSLVQNIQNYTNNLNRAAQSLRMAGAGTQAETKAIREYVRALGEANTARARQNSLVAQEIANQRRVSAGTAPYGQQGPALPPAMVKSRQIQQNWNRFFQEAAQVGQELQTTAAAKTVNIRNSWNRFFQEAAQVGQELQTTAAAKTVNIRNSWNRFFQEATEVAVELTVQAQRTAAAIRSNEGAASAAARQRLADAAAQRQRITNAGFGVQGPALPPTAAGTTGAGFRGRIGGAVSGAVIGGAFPLLFGQSGGAAAGGAIGGLVGGLAGPGGSFAGSLLGTLIGDIASRGQAVKQLGEDLGFSVTQTKQLADAFKTANTDIEKFTAVIQNVRGLGLELEDQAKAIQLVTTLTEKYGGSFEKTGNAITSALESGKVTQATLNQLTSQGINIQGELANKYGVSRDAILKMAKDGDISVQTLIDTLVKMGNEGVTAVNKPKTAMERLTASVNTLGQSLAGLATNLVRAFGPALQWLTDRVTDFVNAVSRAISRLSDLMSGGRMAQADIQAARAAETATQRKFGILGGIRALNPAAQKFYESQKQAELRRLVPGAFAPAAPAAGPLTSFRVPSQAAPSGGAGAKGPKPPEDRTALLQEDLEAMKLMSVTQDGIRDALFEGNKELAIRLEYDQKVADINRDAAKALLNANYETEKTVIKAQEIVRLKDAQLERDDKLRELARDIDEIITNTLDDVRGGVTWDDTGMREIFDMRLPDAIKEAKENLADLADPTTQIIGAATAIGDAFSESFKSIVSGAVSARESLSNFFKSIGDYFIDMAARIAAEALKLQAIQLLQSLLSPLLGGFGVGSMGLPGLQGTGALSSGPIFAGGAFAEGGFVTGPTRALIGEGGEPEYVIPASKMRTAMGRYSAGARGSSVVSGSGQISSENGGGVATMEPIDVRYSIERINNVDYVTADQFQRGMAQAAQQGAIQGERRAMRSLKNSSATRRGVGI
jgi:tape measure domain-containing protein